DRRWSARSAGRRSPSHGASPAGSRPENRPRRDWRERARPAKRPRPQHRRSRSSAAAAAGRWPYATRQQPWSLGAAPEFLGGDPRPFGHGFELRIGDAAVDPCAAAGEGLEAAIDGGDHPLAADAIGIIADALRD